MNKKNCKVGDCEKNKALRMDVGWRSDIEIPVKYVCHHRRNRIAHQETPSRNRSEGVLRACLLPLLLVSGGGGGWKQFRGD